MITKHDLQEAIAECEGERNPNANTCIKLAAYYTIMENLYPDPIPQYSYAAEPEVVKTADQSDFMKAVNGKNVNEVLDVIDELMEALQVMYPRLYDGVLRKLK